MKFLEELFSIESGVVFVAIIAGLILGKMISQALQKAGVPIAGGDPQPVSLPAKGA